MSADRKMLSREDEGGMRKVEPYFTIRKGLGVISNNVRPEKITWSPLYM